MQDRHEQTGSGDFLTNHGVLGPSVSRLGLGNSIRLLNE